jgi:hypothetical protein
VAIIESYGSWELVTNDDGTFSAQPKGSNSPTVIKDYGGNPYSGGDIAAVENFNGSLAVLFSGGHVWYVDGSWTKAPVGPGGKDTENLSTSDIPTYFFSDSPPPSYGDAGAPAPVPDPEPVVPPSGGSDSGVELESYGAYSLYKMDDGTFRVNSETGEQIKDYGGSVYRGGDIVAADLFNNSTAVLFSSGHLWYVDGTWTKAPTGPGGRDTENLSAEDMSTYFFSDSPPNDYVEGGIPAPAPVPDPEPVVPPSGGSDSGVELESYGAYSLYKMDDGTFRVNSETGEQIKDYGGSVYRGGDIVAADLFNNSTAVLFSSGHLWYVDGTWTKAPTGPGGRDTENLSAEDMSTYFSSDSPPNDYVEGGIPAPAPVPDPEPVVPPSGGSDSGVELESYGAYSLYKMDDGTFRVNSETGEQIKDYGGSVYRGGDIVAVDDFNGSRAVLFGSGHIWYVDSSWTKAPTGPNGNDTANIQPSEMPTYFFSNNPPPTYDEGATPAPIPPVGDPGDDGSFSDEGDELESFGAFSLYRMNDNTFRVGSTDGPLVRDYGGSVYRGGDIVAAENFNGSKAVLFGSGHVWYVDDNWTKAPVGPGGRDTENLSARDMVLYFSSDAPPADYESGDDADPIDAPIAPPPADNDVPATTGFELESFGSFSLYRMDDNTFRIGSLSGPRVRDYGGTVYRGGDVVAVDYFNGNSKAVLFGSGHLWYVDDNWTKAPVGPDGRDTENLSTGDMARYFYSDTPPVMYAPVEDDIPRVPPSADIPGEDPDYSTEGFIVEGFGSYPLYGMTDGTYRVGSLDGELVKDYGGRVWRGGAIVAADEFNGAKAVVFDGGHVWYVDDTWTKAPVGPNGRDTEQLTFSEVNTYFYNSAPPADFGSPIIGQPVEQPSEGDYSTEGRLAEEFGDWPLYRMNDGTYRVGSLDGPLIKDYGGSVWQGGTIVAADKFNGALAVVFEGGHLWYVNSNWTKAQVGPQGRDTENLTISQLANYFYNDNPPLFFDNDEFVTSPPAPELPVDGGSPATTGTVIESFGSYSLYRMGDGTYRVNSLEGEQIKDAGGQVWTGGGVVAVDDVNGVRTIAFADGNVWYADASWTKANVGPEGKSADAFTDEEISKYFFDNGAPVVEPEEPDEFIPPDSWS